MTNPTDQDTTERQAMVANLLHLVSELRGLKDRATQSLGREVTFAEVAHSSVAGRKDTSPKFHGFLVELAEILDTNAPAEVDSELDKHWRGSLQAWLKRQA